MPNKKIDRLYLDEGDIPDDGFVRVRAYDKDYAVKSEELLDLRRFPDMDLERKEPRITEVYEIVSHNPENGSAVLKSKKFSERWVKGLENQILEVSD